jgi:hypothetical protein
MQLRRVGRSILFEVIGIEGFAEDPAAKPDEQTHGKT